MSQDETLSSAQAAELLCVKLETLYAYTSRGLLRSLPGEHGRARRYLRSDLERLRSRREVRHASPGAAALRLGEPVLDSSITALSEGIGPLYRGRAAVELAASATPFESVAELLWTGSLPPARPRWTVPDPVVSARQLGELLPPGGPPLICLALALPALAAADPGRFDTRPEATVDRARLLIPRLAALLGLAAGAARTEQAAAAGSVVQILAAALGSRSDPAALALLEMVLVLLADHELNSSAFAARVAASTEADLYACLSAAIATLSGPLHGSASERVEALVIEAGRPEEAEATVHSRMRRGEQVPGFGHLIYKQGDPRAVPLLEAAWKLAPDSVFVRTLLSIIDAMRAAGRPEPNVDVALAAVGAALELAPGVCPALFGIARCAGWVAHVLEQYEAGFLMRPRARYQGLV